MKIEVLTEDGLDKCIQIALKSLQTHHEFQTKGVSDGKLSQEWQPSPLELSNFKQSCNLKS